MKALGTEDEPPGMSTWPISAPYCGWQPIHPARLSNHIICKFRLKENRYLHSVFRDILTAQGPMLAVALIGLLGLSVPTGAQVVAGKFREDLFLEAGAAIEQAMRTGTALAPMRRAGETQTPRQDPFGNMLTAIQAPA